MIKLPCRICGSENIRKYGKTGAGAQKYHCRACSFCGTPVTQEEKQKKKEEVKEKLLYGRMPVRGIARSLSAGRMRVKMFIKKRNPGTCSRNCENRGASGYWDG